MMMKQIIYLLFLVLFNNIQSIIGINSDKDYYRYLQQFGYTPKNEGRLFSVLGRSSDNQGIKTFQRLYKLPVSDLILIISTISIQKSM
jgi:hypothetical protein